MASPEQQPDKQESTRRELRQRLVQETDSDFAGINRDLLNDTDIDIYDKLCDGTLTSAELVSWRNEIFATEKDRPKADTDALYLREFSDRGNFAAWITNKFGSLQLEEMRRKGQL